MQKLPALLLITVCFFIQTAYIEGQSYDSFIAPNDDFTLIDTYYLGRAVSANILTYYVPYTRNQEAVQYLNRICQTLVINSSGPPVFNGYHVMILDSNEYNAFASPGGHIFVTKKLVESAASEDMLAAVIAHELAHIMLRHSVAIIKETKTENELSSIASWAAGTAARFSNTARQAANYRNYVIKTVDTLMKNGYSQAQEFEADIEAIKILANAGYDPTALIDVLKVLQQFQGSQRGGFYSTHPSPYLRMANLEKYQYPARNTRQYRVTRFTNLKL